MSLGSRVYRVWVRVSGLSQERREPQSPKGSLLVSQPWEIEHSAFFFDSLLPLSCSCPAKSLNPEVQQFHLEMEGREL